MVGSGAVRVQGPKPCRTIRVLAAGLGRGRRGGAAGTGGIMNESAAPATEEAMGAPTGRPTLWNRMALSGALLAAAGSVLSLLMPGPVYGQETAALFDAAIAQDLVNLFIAAPLTVVLALLARRGSLAARLCLPGLLVFTAYNYMIYAFSIHFGPLFLLWVAVLGLSAYAAGGTFIEVHRTRPAAYFDAVPVRLASWVLIVLAAVFSLLWLSEIVPDLLAGRGSTSAAAWQVPTNPVHVLDLAFFLPGVLASGVLLLRRRQPGYVLAAAALVFLALTCLPAMVTPFVAHARGNETGWIVLVPMVLVLATTAVALWRLLQGTRRTVLPAPA